MSSDANRLEDIEIRLAHQDKLISDLNEVITTQWKRIEMLERQLRRLDEEVQSLDSGEGHIIQKPPHY